ncbi:DUF2577 domain-containing protein [Leptotrichia sp. OH3620_COT-345]|uniref:DUF2577 family protein n=1 Tax=Leptotrichia sp. OH3620_COT-345 TaxID=2491048 RepID=UPI000F64AF40|nr:DUF2577 family protein [Leptotrichia sp. OH3620_COT-345]RRD38822.1 DUF2577 domain-containing protein [Leptotrichia sp. OH3620_COT-345]
MEEKENINDVKHEEPDKSYNALAQVLQEKFKNPDWNGPFLGTVIEAPPNLRVKIDEKIILNKDKIIVAWEKVKGYNREFEEKGNIKIEIEEINISDNSNQDSGGNIHKKIVASGKLSGTYKAEGNNKWTDELKIGDEVILNEFKNQKKFYLVDKAYQY